MYHATSQLQQCEQMIQQLMQQTAQATQKYQQLLQQEQQNVTRLEELAQRERQAVQIVQTALQGHQVAMQQMQQVTNICHQLQHGMQMSAPMPMHIQAQSNDMTTSYTQRN